MAWRANRDDVARWDPGLFARDYAPQPDKQPGTDLMLWTSVRCSLREWVRAHGRWTAIADSVIVNRRLRRLAGETEKRPERDST